MSVEMLRQIRPIEKKLNKKRQKTNELQTACASEHPSIYCTCLSFRGPQAPELPADFLQAGAHCRDN